MRSYASITWTRSYYHPGRDSECAADAAVRPSRARAIEYRRWPDASQVHPAPPRPAYLACSSDLRVSSRVSSSAARVLATPIPACGLLSHARPSGTSAGTRGTTRDRPFDLAAVICSVPDSISHCLTACKSLCCRRSFLHLEVMRNFAEDLKELGPHDVRPEAARGARDRLRGAPGSRCALRLPIPNVPSGSTHDTNNAATHSTAGNDRDGPAAAASAGAVLG